MKPSLQLVFCSIFFLIIENAIAQAKNGNFSFDLSITENDLVEIDVAPEEIADGWKTSTLAAQGLNPLPIARLVKHIRRQDYHNIHSLLIIRKGKLVSEHYFGTYKSRATGERHAYDRATLHQTRSSFKSVTGLLAGIMIEEGLFSPEDLAMKSLQKLQHFETADPQKKKITLTHLLNMTSGLDCSEMPGTGPQREAELRNTVNMVKSHGELAMARIPGERWRYCSTNSLLLGFAMHVSLSQKEEGPLKFFLDTKLMAPLDIFHYQTGRSPRGYMLMHGGQRMRPRDLAKFGQLIVSNGIWNGKQIVPKSWIENIKRQGVPTDWSWTKSALPEQQNMSPSGYANQWFQTRMKVKGKEYSLIHTWGNGGQFVIAIPKLDLVVTTTAGNYGAKHMENQKQIFHMLYHFIVQSIKDENL